MAVYECKMLFHKHIYPAKMKKKVQSCKLFTWTAFVMDVCTKENAGWPQRCLFIKKKNNSLDE